MRSTSGRKERTFLSAAPTSSTILGPRIESIPTTAADPNNPCATLLSLSQSLVHNPFVGTITRPQQHPVVRPTVQKFQLQLPYPQFTGVATDLS